MHPYFSYEYTGEPLAFFSTSHNIAILTIFFFTLIVILFRKRLRERLANVWFRYLLAGVLLLSEVSLQIWFLFTDTWSLMYSLPLHLCSFSLLLSIAMLLTKNYALFEFVYIAGLAGAIQAILTPDLGIYGFPHFRAIQFFIAHGTVVAACFYMIFVEGYKPRFRSVWTSWMWLNFYALLVGGVNRMTGGNYLFLAHKPESASLIDLLGPWPWYILSLEGVAIVMFLLFYLPFSLYEAIHQHAARKPSHISPPAP